MHRDYYSPKDVTEVTGASASAVRIYTDRYARYLSTEATAIPRKFTLSDMKLIAFIVHCTKERAMTHDQVEASLKAGELEAFDWEMPVQSKDTAQQEQSTALVPVAQLQAVQYVLEETRQREAKALQAAEALRTEATARAQTLQDEIARLQHELGQAQGALSQAKETIESQRATRRRPRWWVALFGGE